MHSLFSLPLCDSDEEDLALAIAQVQKLASVAPKIETQGQESLDFKSLFNPFPSYVDEEAGEGAAEGKKKKKKKNKKKNKSKKTSIDSVDPDTTLGDEPLPDEAPAPAPAPAAPAAAEDKTHPVIEVFAAPPVPKKVEEVVEAVEPPAASEPLDLEPTTVIAPAPAPVTVTIPVQSQESKTDLPPTPVPVPAPSSPAPTPASASPSPAPAQPSPAPPTPPRPLASPPPPSSPAGSKAPLPGSPSPARTHSVVQRPSPPPPPISDHDRADGKKKLTSNVSVLLKDAKFKLAPGSEVIPYERLVGLRVEDGIDPTRKEEYLSVDEFKKHLGLSQEEFKGLPSWKQQQKKKAVHLF